MKRSSSVEVSALQATVMQLQSDVDDSSKIYLELQLVEVSHGHSLLGHIFSLALSVCVVIVEAPTTSPCYVSVICNEMFSKNSGNLSIFVKFVSIKES